MRLQLRLRTVLWMTAIFAVFAVLGRWLLSAGVDLAIGVTTAGGAGLLVGMATCLLHQYANVGKALIHPLLVLLVAVPAWWFAGNFLTFLLGVAIGTLAMLRGGSLASFVFRQLGLTFSANKRHPRS